MCGNKIVMTNPAKRIGYVDALRGLTMMLVVFSHLYIPNHSIINQVFINFRMPLFFFVSGYISFRMEQAWSGGDVCRRVVEKCRMLLLPVIFFGMLYTLVVGEWSIWDFFYAINKRGYWFTFALFVMLLIYYILRYVVSRRGYSLKAAVWIMLGVAVVMRLLDEELWLDATAMRIMSLKRVFNYFAYFAFGIVAGCYRERFVAYVSRNALWSVCSLLFVAMSAVMIVGVESTVVRDMLRFVVGALGIVMIYGLFQRLGEVLDRGVVGRAMQYVGRHTLEVYVIHYFLLINFLPVLRDVVTSQESLFVPLVVGLPLAIVVTAASLAVGYLLCRVPYVGYYVLGRREKRRSVVLDK